MRNTVKVSKRHPVDLFADILSHRIAQLGCHTGHNPSLYIRKQRTDYIQACKENQNLSDCMKVDASGSGQHRNQTFKQFGCCLTQNLWSKDGKDGAGCCTNKHQNNAWKELFQIGKQFSHRSLEVLGFFARHHSMRSTTSYSWSCHYANSSITFL